MCYFLQDFQLKSSTNPSSGCISWSCRDKALKQKTGRPWWLLPFAALSTTHLAETKTAYLIEFRGQTENKILLLVWDTATTGIYILENFCGVSSVARFFLLNLLFQCNCYISHQFPWSFWKGKWLPTIDGKNYSIYTLHITVLRVPFWNYVVWGVLNIDIYINTYSYPFHPLNWQHVPIFLHLSQTIQMNCSGAVWCT